jgi:hypothetical protein
MSHEVVEGYQAGDRWRYTEPAPAQTANTAWCDYRGSTDSAGAYIGSANALVRIVTTRRGEVNGLAL